jgi:hypothetical protein
LKIPKRGIKKKKKLAKEKRARSPSSNNSSNSSSLSSNSLGSSSKRSKGTNMLVSTSQPADLLAALIQNLNKSTANRLEDRSQEKKKLAMTSCMGPKMEKLFVLLSACS